ncbi:hypothetical protein MP228_001448 [Amoeboaphelidium protococcarum]|nr:hypothetical protein MP228_001448 [Amoeboaphelidium protococcarum]
MLIVGLTGGIASGKSTASEYIKKTLKIPVIDADVIARDVVRVGQPAYREIVKTFGAEVVREDNGGQLDREKLGKLIFANTALKSKLNSITHPKIRWEILKQVLYYYVRANDIVVLDIALLFESGLNRFTHSNVLIYAEDDVQLERLMKRNPELTREDAQNRITAQMPMKKKVDLADHVVMNDGSIEDLHERIDEIFSNKLKTSRWKTWLFLAMPVLMVFSIAMNQISG